MDSTIPGSRQRFLDLDFLTGPEALIPQKETELLGAMALKFLRELIQERGHATVVDLCTGAGNLAIALAHHAPECRVHAADLNERSVALARRNAQLLNVAGRVQLAVGDLFSPFENPSFFKNVDLIVCNPPYISSAKVDTMAESTSKLGPRMAFDGGPFGLSILSRLITESPRFLKPASILCFEVGVGQGPYMAKLMKRMPEYSEVETACDFQGNIRVVVGRTPP